MTELAFVPILLSLPSFPLSGLDSIVTLELNLSVLSISPLTPLAIVNSFDYLTSKVEHIL
ncbi:hypothetical protein E2C01_047394 [Portunus trituberculatus]|uniref:Uncharacterized protein n=1 Tax=Portunus trituberculatus TaxID=210409 RepID=A0A5B7G0A7_PORTR|nr:hypothetical protein [Portunus trituberculatus]